MSLVYITHHNENVSDYEKVSFVETPIKKMKYTSKYKRSVKKQINQPYITLADDGRLLITDSGKHERRTMGCAKTPLDPPKCFLRKNQGLKWKRLHDHKCPKVADLPPVPKVSEIPPKPVCKPSADKPEQTVVVEVIPQPQPEIEIVIETPKVKEATPKPSATTQEKKVTPQCDPCEYLSKQKKTPRVDPCETPRELKCEAEQPCRTKGGKESCEEEGKKPRDPCKRTNFIARNIKRIKCAKTIRPPPRYVDTPVGETHNLINSGLIPQHICGRNFAKVPCYLAHHKKLLQKYREACASEKVTMEDCDDFIKKQGVRKMTLEERVALLAGLKANYMEQLKIFQTLSLYTDTPTKKLRKSRLEKDLDQLEMDIKFIQDNTDIYLSDI